jgi:hypothetical protein
MNNASVGRWTHQTAKQRRAAGSGCFEIAELDGHRVTAALPQDTQTSAPLKRGKGKSSLGMIQICGDLDHCRGSELRLRDASLRQSFIAKSEA